MRKEEMNRNFQNASCKEDNYIKAWLKQTENPEFYKNLNDLDDQSYTNEFVKVVDFNNFNSNFINNMMEEPFGDEFSKQKKRKAYSLFYSNEIGPNDEENYDLKNIYTSFDDSDVKYLKSLDKTPSGNMKDRVKGRYKDEHMSIKKLKRENICNENNEPIFPNNIMMDNSPYYKFRHSNKKPSYGSESTNEFFNNYDFETPIKILSSKKKSYDFKNRKDNSTNTTKENSSRENVSSNNSETKRTINFSNKTDDFNDIPFNSDNEYISSPEYMDHEQNTKYINKKQREVNFLGQKLEYKVVGNVINCSKNHPQFTLF
ncbi:hypothetical protein PFAG_04759 [Plasmodium falciparum Santa Lucia]|uniref:Uncharacterized protein n=8 Tax=Plasmodium falciparum TaxID=5833 RepID=W4J017_PLAFP|nr:hypothetical protein PFFVO_04307 [Plasmodium falciparum Vietnam Oak-Knoll (FVO)]ETW29427.1 hypothetical protein PFFCH_03140 [Plasmodium falciparum FCH/4]ETW55570.1 hypothetical protein PFUGPA_02335 [Plasmodium falciparum Palo Alto/Uganda]ETW59475.1 hypothetical protein PFMC_04664 [Plasmodium falciparum CAMP/Malaysia]EUT80115.1 hypothetical protein PFAG_04759 [Plasmodium falciparum Santa Lucia]EWC74524.1 hypothetical protein C923_04791 [Plasmodium falciparum UGT5.1]KOB60430.1 hypothetical p